MVKRFLFSGTVVSNGGDRAIVEAQLALLRQHYPDCHVVVANDVPAVAERVLDRASGAPSAYTTLVRRQCIDVPSAEWPASASRRKHVRRPDSRAVPGDGSVPRPAGASPDAGRPGRL